MLRCNAAERVSVSLLLFVAFATTTWSQVPDRSRCTLTYEDLFELTRSWQSGAGSENLVELLAAWQTPCTPTPISTSTPTSTPTKGPGSTRVLSLMQGAQAFITNPSSPFASIQLPLRLNEGAEVTAIAFVLPHFSSSADYTATVSTIVLPRGMQRLGWSMEVEVTAEGRSVSLSGPAFLSDNETVVEVTYHVTTTSQVPYPQDQVIPIDFVPGSTSLNDGALAHTTAPGSIVVNPSGNPIPTATPTATQGLSTNTPTPTDTPTGGGEGSALRLTLCETETYTGRVIRFWVDLVHDGRVVNPGTTGGAPSVPVVVTLVDGFFPGTGQSEMTLPANAPTGIELTMTRDTPGEVLVSATAPGYAPAGPRSTTFLDSAMLGGRVLLAQEGGAEPTPASYATVRVVDPSTGDVVVLGGQTYFLDGFRYEVRGIPPGTYDLEFEPPTGAFFGSTLYRPDCTTHTGITLAAGEVRLLDDLVLPIEDNPATVTGTVLTGGAELPPAYNSQITALRAVGSCVPSSQTAVVANDLLYSVDVTPGSYNLYATVTDTTYRPFLQTRVSVPFSVAAGETVERDIAVLPSSPIAPLAPINLDRAGAAPTFSWTDVGLTNHTLYVIDRCGELVWTVETPSTTLVYSGPALDGGGIYTWYVSGVRQEGDEVVAVGALFPGQLPPAIPQFLVN